MRSVTVPGSLDGPPGTLSRRGFLLACLACTLLLAALLVLLRQPADPAQTVSWTRDLVLVLLALAAAACCWRIATVAQGWHRRVWTLFCLSALIWTVGRIVAAYDGNTGAAPNSHLVLSDTIRGLSLVPVVLGLAAIPAEPRVRSERFRSWLGAGVVVASILMFCRSLTLVLPPPEAEGTVLGRAIQFGYPVIHVALATVVWIVLLRVGTEGRTPLHLVSAGLLVYAWANVYFAFHVGKQGTVSRQVLDAGSAWCYLLFILAALSPHAVNPKPPSTKAKSRYVGFLALALYIPVLIATVVVALLPRTLDPILVVTGVCVLVLFGLRLVLLSSDNSQLRQDLEGRVDDLLQSSADLRRLGLQNERIVQSVVDGVLGLDANGVITFANPAAAAMLGYRRADLLDLREEDLFHGTGRCGDQPPLGPKSEECCIVRTAMVTGTARTSESQYFVASDRRVFPVELAVGPILEEGAITGAVVVFRDVSERRKIETMKNEFVSVVSHELRTPLTSIRGSLGLLAGGAAGPLPTMADRMVTVALDSSERLTRLINDMLDIERIESGTMPVRLTDCDPRSLIDHSIDGVRGLAGDHQLVVTAAAHLSPVRADADRIVQTLTNLIGNAIKFSPAGTTIEISAENNRSRVDFAVADQGSGIPATHLGRIFERFEQVDSSDGREKGGSGLGLAISRTIVRRHGGDLTVTSELGVGSTFRFSLPAVEDGSHVSPASPDSVQTLRRGDDEAGAADRALVGPVARRMSQ